MADEAIKSLAVKLALENGSFNKGIADLKQSLNVVNSGFKASVAGVKDWGANIDALKNNASALGDKITLQKQIVGKYAEELDKSKKALDDNSAKMLDIKDNLDKTTAAYKDSVTATGKNSDETKQLKVQLDSLTDQYTKSEKVVINNKTSLNKLTTEYNNAKGEVNKLESELEETTAAIDKQAKRFQNLSTHIKTAAGHMGSGLVKGAKLATGAMAGMAAGVAGAVLGLGKLMGKSAESADVIAESAEKYGKTTDEIQKMQYVGKGLDVELSTMLKGQTLLTKAMYAAKDGTGAQADAFKALGVSATDSNGNLRDASTVQTELFDKLKAMPNATERNALSLKLFGKSAMELNPLINAGGTAIAKMGAEAEKSGAVMSKATIEGLDKFKDSSEQLKQSAMGMAGTMMSSLLPAMQGLIGSATKLAGSFGDAMKTGDFSAFGEQLGNTLSNAVGKLAEFIPKIIDVIVKVLPVIVEAVVQALPKVFPALVKGVFDLIGAVAQMLIDNAPLLIDALVKTVTAIVAGYSAMVPKLLELAIVLVKELAKGLVTAIPEMLKAAVQLISDLVTYLLNPENLSALLKAALDIVVAIVKGLVEAIPQLIDAAIQLIMSLVDFILDPKNIGMLLKAAWDIVVALSKGLIKAIPQLVIGIGKVIDEVFVALDNALAPLGKWFGDKFGEAWTAIKGAFSNVGEFFGGIWDTIKSKFTSIGSSIGNAMGGAFKSAVNSVINFAEKTINGFISDINWAIKVINKIPGVEINPLKQIDIPPMSIGTRYLPKDTLVNAHAGEMIVPRSENPYANSGGRVLPGGAVFNITVGTLVGSDGMNEFAGIISQRMAGNLALNGG